MSYTDIIPEEITRKIFGEYLSIHDLFICRRVCHSWKRPAEEVLRTTDRLLFMEDGRVFPPFCRCHDEEHAISDKYRVGFNPNISEEKAESALDVILRLCPSLRIIAIAKHQINGYFGNGLVRKILLTIQDSGVCWSTENTYYDVLNEVSLLALEHLTGNLNWSYEVEGLRTFIQAMDRHPSLKSVRIGCKTSDGGEEFDWTILPEGIEYVDGCYTISELAQSPASKTLKVINRVTADDLFDNPNAVSFPSVTEVFLVGDHFYPLVDPDILMRLFCDCFLSFFPSISRLHYRGGPVGFSATNNDEFFTSFPLPILRKLEHIELDICDIELRLWSQIPQLPPSVTLNVTYSIPFEMISQIVKGVHVLHLLAWRLYHSLSLEQLSTFIETFLENGDMKVLKISSEDVNHFNKADMTALRSLRLRLKNIQIYFEGCVVNLMCKSTSWNSLVFEAI
jgi:hypothetical protein